MATQRPYLRPFIVGIAVILSSTAGIAGLIGWLPASTGGSGDIPAPGSVPAASATRVAAAPLVQSDARARGRCAECGVVVFTREIDAHDESAGRNATDGAVAGDRDEPRAIPARRYETTIRMADRSSRVIRDGSPAGWRTGEHVIVIDGANASNR